MCRVGLLLDLLVKEGKVSDETKARSRLELGYPSWLVFEDLEPGEREEVLSRFGGFERLDRGLEGDLLDVKALREGGPANLKSRRWAPLSDGRTAVADPFGPLPDGPVCVAPAGDIDRALDDAPVEDGDRPDTRRLGRVMLDRRVLEERDLALALGEQRRSGGRLGEVLVARGTVSPGELTGALSDKTKLPTMDPGDEPNGLLPRRQARSLRAVALSDERSRGTEGWARKGALPVAFVEPDAGAVEAVTEYLGRPIQPKLTDEETMNRLQTEVYAEEDTAEATTSLRREIPHLSAFSNTLSLSQAFALGAVTVALLIGLVLDPFSTAIVAASVGSFFYLGYNSYRIFTAIKGWRGDSTADPTMEQLRSLDEASLPVYTILLPVYGEKPSTVRTLVRSLSEIDYPKHKLDGILLVEEDDDETMDAVARAGKPAWLKVLPIPPGEPRTKPKAMIHGLMYAKGDLLTIYDAEDKPDPLQLKKAVWTFRDADDDSLACLQAKLNYYNPRQNLLTRWFTLEYSAWFDLFLPGLHKIGAPIPLGGTSNHFRTEVLKEARSWDPYNVTEDADLGLRFARLGKKTMMLESTTYEEANSKLGNWLRQRSRWIKGYMQTFLVHTRHPVELVREIGAKNTFSFFAVFAGSIVTTLILPVFWALLILWFAFQPAWMPALFPGALYYIALANLVLGNFFFIFLGLAGAVIRGHDDLTPYTLLVPIYWLLMSAAGYLALYELILRPHHWQKTEHGLHDDEEQPQDISVYREAS